MGTLVAILAVTTTGCTTQRYWGGSTAVGNNTQAKIGLVTKTDTNPYFVELRESAQAAAARRQTAHEFTRWPASSTATTRAR